jgi:hypothetical protein
VSSLLERDAEMRELGRALSASEAGEGAVVLVVGGPGLGKTRLMEAAGRLAEPKGFRVLRARGAELETTFPFGVARQVLEPPLAGLSPDERAGLFEGAAALARPLFEGAEPLPRNGARFAALTGLYWLAVQIADRGPLLLLVDDAHRADAASLQFLEYLARRVSGVPLALVVAGRTGGPGESEDSLEGLALSAGAHVLRPAPLSEEGVARLTAERLGHEPDPVFSRACRKATGGNPLFLEELLRDLRAQAIDPVAAAAPLVGEVGPDAVARLARARLELVGAEAVELARRPPCSATTRSSRSPRRSPASVRIRRGPRRTGLAPQGSSPPACGCASCTRSSARRSMVSSRPVSGPRATRPRQGSSRIASARPIGSRRISC